MGIGDVTRPLVPAVIEALSRAVLEMRDKKTFRGYSEEQGYGFLRQAVCNYFKKKGVVLSDQEIFISDGAKSDLGNILDIFGTDNTVLIPDPVYPVYVDTNIMSGRKIIFMRGTADNNFLPMPDNNVEADIIYLCSPNNPTGAVYSKDELECWVRYALEREAVILLTVHTKALYRIRICLPVYIRLRGPKNVQLNFAPCLKPPDLPERDAATLSYPRSSFGMIHR